MKKQQKKFAGRLLKQRYGYVFTFYESKYSFIVLQMHNYIIYNQAKDKYKRKTFIEDVFVITRKSYCVVLATFLLIMIDFSYNKSKN